MSRTIVLRVDQRSSSRTITISAFLEVDGHAIPNGIRMHKVSTSEIGVFDQAAMGTLIAAVKTAIRNVNAELPVAGGWA